METGPSWNVLPHALKKAVMHLFIRIFRVFPRNAVFATSGGRQRQADHHDHSVRKLEMLLILIYSPLEARILSGSFERPDKIRLTIHKLSSFSDDNGSGSRDATWTRPNFSVDTATAQEPCPISQQSRSAANPSAQTPTVEHSEGNPHGAL